MAQFDMEQFLSAPTEVLELGHKDELLEVGAYYEVRGPDNF